MLLTNLKLKNWKNFRAGDLNFRDKTYVLGANASGKSNLLDVFRFLRDLSKAHGGGLQKAVIDRGGVPKLRCLHARQDNEIRIEVELSDNLDDMSPRWRYVLGFKSEGKGAQRVIISSEEVWDGERKIISRPDENDRRDSARLTQTALEQIQANADFREISDFFSRITYLHLVPQLLKFGDRIGGHRLEDDPFGQGFLERIAKTPVKTRDARLRKIQRALSLAVPQFETIRFVKDLKSGRPHLEARYTHYRPQAGWQREEQFSDGTLRLLGLLWSLLEGDSMLLLEEPELSLNDSIVRQIPAMLQRVQRDAKRRSQVIISTHSEALLSNEGIDGRGIAILKPTAEGTEMRHPVESELVALRSGLSVAEVLLPLTRSSSAEELGSWI